MLFINLSNEILEIIFELLPAKALLNLSETCKEALKKCLDNDRLWWKLCKIEYQVDLKTLEPFTSFAEFYELVYKAVVVHNEEIKKETCAALFLPKKEIFVWHTLRRNVCPASYKRQSFSSLNRKQVKSIWGLKDKDLCNQHGVKRYNYYWAEAYDSAVLKMDSVERFQSAILKKFWKCKEQVDEVFERSLKKQRYNKYLELRIFVYGVANKQTLFRNGCLFKKFISNSEESLESNTYQDMLRLIGNDYITGNLRFGMKQLKEYLNLIKQFGETELESEDAHLISEDRKPSLLTTCVLLIYSSFRDSSGVFGRLVSTSELLEKSQRYLGRINQVMIWKGEQGQDFRDKYTEDIESSELFSLFIKTGDSEEFSRLKTYFQGKHKLHTWIDRCCWIQEILDKSLVEMLKGETQPTTNFPHLKQKMDIFLSNGTTVSFREVLRAVYDNAKDSLEFYNHMLVAFKNQVDNEHATDEELAVSSIDIFQFYAEKIPWNLLS